MKSNYLFFIFIFIILFLNLSSPIKGQNNTSIKNQPNGLKNFKNESNLIFSSNYFKVEDDETHVMESTPQKSTSKKELDNVTKKNEKSRFCLSIKDEAPSEQVSKLYIIILYNILLVPPFFILITIIFYNYTLY
ncbi:hypothetical protein ACTFIU_007374 [Dictyostelium citrinum]